jgi:hypothetical protein
MQKCSIRLRNASSRLAISRAKSSGPIRGIAPTGTTNPVIDSGVVGGSRP